jgi:uncharacterized repeat protein (TIGR02543 family)
MKRVSLTVFVLTVLLCAGFLTCQNSIMEKWWNDGSNNTPIPIPGPGGSGENFGIVVFDTDGGTPQPLSIKIAWGGTVGRLRPVSRGNDGFLGWFDENGIEWPIETREVTKDDVNSGGFIVLTAKWKEDSPAAVIYTVSFVTAPSPVTIPPQLIGAGGKVVQPVKPPALDNGNAFAGWYTEVGYTHRWNFDLPPASDVTLYAKWEQDTRTVHFEPNGGKRPDGITELEPELVVALSYGLIQDPGPLVKEGYHFDGWYIEADFSGTQWNFAIKKVTDSDVPSGNPLTLYAKWERNIYFVEFVITPSTADVPERQLILHGEKVIQPDDPPHLEDDSIFAGWYTEDTFLTLWDFDNFLVTNNVTLFARFAPQTRTIIFKVNGGMDLPRSEFTIPVGNPIQNPGAPSRTGYMFRGWFFDPACIPGTGIDFTRYRIEAPDNIIGMDPLYLYAGWIVFPYNVTFNIEQFQGGTSLPYGQITSQSQLVNHGERILRPDIPAQPEYSLVGWYTNEQLTVPWDFDTDTTTAHQDLYAKWEETNYIVVFHLGETGSQVTIPSLSAPTGLHHLHLDDRVIEPFMQANIDPDGWSFYGWYSSREPSTMPATINNGDITSAQRDSYLSDEPWDFNTQLYEGNTTLVSGSTRILNLYARWVPAVPDMVWVPRGSFVMGDSGVSGSPAAYHAYPTRRITLDGFYISRYPITQFNDPPLANTDIKGYWDVMGNNPSQFTQTRTRPVERVSWYDAIEYCMKLTEGTGLNPVYSMTIIRRAPTALSGTGGLALPIIEASVSWNNDNPNGFRLPTEAEWEFAARGGYNPPESYIYSGSNDASFVAWYNETVQGKVPATGPGGIQMPEGGSTQTVGRLTPNNLGIYDMSGNVSEWVWDYFAPYSSLSGQLNNPRGPAVAYHTPAQRVRRGGGWSNAIGNVRSVVRNSDTPDTATWVNGFRVVRGPSVIW